MNDDNNEYYELQEDIQLSEALIRLKENKDFKKLIEELYLDSGAINLTKNLAVVEKEEKIIEQYKARSWLYRFFIDIENNGLAAVEALKNWEIKEQ